MQKIDLRTLENKLWDCANILRGTLNSSQYMDYIFGMLFLKRINDQFDMERQEKRELGKVVMAPAPVLDYIVVHEMCHMVHRNHSRDFWQLLERILPDYEKRKEWLRNNGIRLDRNNGIRLEM